MKSDSGTLSTNAGLRFMGDRLEPQRVTALLGTEPTVAYRKGEIARPGTRYKFRGRTGLWWVSSSRRVSSTDLKDHLGYLIGILFPDGKPDLVEPLRLLMAEDGLKADVDCFWYGEHGAQPPEIPDYIRQLFARLPAPIETDYDTD